jgi:mannitol-1-phosphate/altronate dehydrogenase
MYRDRLMSQGQGLDWAICGVGVMPNDRRMKEVLDAQDGLYTLVEKHSLRPVRGLADVPRDRDRPRDLRDPAGAQHP